MSESLLSAFRVADQAQVFQYWDTLDETQRAHLAAQAAEIDLDEIARLAGSLSEKSVPADEFSSLKPAPVTPRVENGGSEAAWAAAKKAGVDALRDGKVAAFTVAGGQGTRLGFDGPKGTFPVTPVTGKSLFQVFAEKIQAAGDRYGKPIPWLIMTSDLNHAATEAFFADHEHFGLDPNLVIFFQQGTMPAVDSDGKILLSAPDQIALSPDGHGGSLRALVRSGALDKIEELGCNTISYFQVDNPLVRPIDPEFIGFHILGGSQFSSKALPKAYPEEKVGIFCRLENKSGSSWNQGSLCVVEYSDMPEELMHAKKEDGSLKFGAGSIAIHVIDRDFVRSVGSGTDESTRLPFHQAHKKIPVVGADGQTVTPEEPNGIKFEMFVFDALPFAKNPVIIGTTRPLDFSPVKNAEGSDSPETCKEDQQRLWAGWFKDAGVEMETDETGLPNIALEVSPKFADSAAEFEEKWRSLESKPELVDPLVLA